MRIAIRKLGAWLGQYRHRVLALLGLHLTGWLLLGPAVLLPGMPEDDWLALDQWVRTGVFALVRPEGSLPVTYVDIDDALYRDTWGLPLVTPREELAKMLRTLADAGTALVVVDIDLAWDERDPAFDAFLAAYAGPATLVFIRRLEQSESGLVPFASPYDATFAANSHWLRWAHAYFYSDADGTLRDWSPWLRFCEDGTATVLPAAAVVALEHLSPTGGGPRRPPADCATDFASEPYPIIYTENFAFAEGKGAAALPDPRSPARSIKAAALLDGTRIDTQALFAGRTAIIGGSHSAGQDLRLTPIGILPGAIVQANTILHAQAQIGTGPPAAWMQRVSVAMMFLVLTLLGFPLAVALLAGTAAASVSLFSFFGVFANIELAALLFVQFRILAWLAEPFWKGLREDGWRVLLPDYLRGDRGN